MKVITEKDIFKRFEGKTFRSKSDLQGEVGSAIMSEVLPSEVGLIFAVNVRDDVLKRANEQGWIYEGADGWHVDTSR